MSKNKLMLPVSILLGCIILGGFYYANEVSKRRTIEKQQAIQIAENKKIEEQKKCKFDLTDIKENRYQEDREAYSEECKYVGRFGSIFCNNGVMNYSARHYTYWEIDGMLKNISNKSQYLESIILKIILMMREKFYYQRVI